MKVVVYDIEIKRAIKSRGESKVSGIKYCKGWRDFENMGISCLCAYDYFDRRYRVFMADNIDKFMALYTESDLVVGFNSHNFDNNLILAEFGVDMSDVTFDILREIWKSEGLDPDKFSPKTHGGFGLDDMCKVNFGTEKSGHGAKAPIDFQQGRIGSVVDYCLNDVKLTKDLLDRIVHRGFLTSPKSPGKSIRIDSPFDSLGMKPTGR